MFCVNFVVPLLCVVQSGPFAKIVSEHWHVSCSRIQFALVLFCTMFVGVDAMAACLLCHSFGASQGCSMVCRQVVCELCAVVCHHVRW